MKQNNLFQLWSRLMATKDGKNSKNKEKQLPNITIAPTNNEAALCPLRINEIQDLIAEIIILGKKRGRPSSHQEEFKYVA